MALRKLISLVLPLAVILGAAGCQGGSDVSEDALKPKDPKAATNRPSGGGNDLKAAEPKL